MILVNSELKQGSFVGHIRPFVVYVVGDSNETMDIGNRGFSLAYSQNTCPVVLKF